ncbi:MAG: hypothetical protein RI911_892 [Candidatus Parcubacteria bacterium]
MKTTLYMAMSANGYIAKSDDTTPWSEAEWEHFSTFINEHKNIIIGRRTYEIMKEAGSFDTFTNVTVIVITQQETESDESSHLLFVHSPSDALAAAEAQGITHAVVAGGSTINGLFLEQGLIDEIRLDVEPMVFTKGISLCSTVLPLQLNLTLNSVTQINTQSIHLHYSVQK